jgi:AcrR family transcriptional regulator
MPRRVDQKQWIRRQAAVLWAAKGYHATGVQELCDVTGLGKGALYYHIETKQKLLYEISLANLETTIAEAQLIVASDSDATTRLRRLCQHLIRNIAECRPEWTVFAQEINTLRGHYRTEVMDQRARYEQIWSRLIQEGADNAEFREVDRVTVMGILGMHNWTYLWVRPDGSMSADEIANRFCDLILRGLGAEQLEAGAAAEASVGSNDG